MSLRLPTLGFLLLLLLTACGQLGSPTTTDLSPAATAGGTIVAWGNNAQGQTNVPALPAGVSYIEAAAGNGHSLAVRSDGQVVAWGRDTYGQNNVPVLPEGMRYTKVGAGNDQSLAVRSDGQVVGWGNNSYGQATVPALPEGVSYTAVAGGIFYSMALRSDGTVVGWGYNFYGQTNVPALPEGVSYTAVAGGGSHILALRSDGQVVAWGRNFYGQTNVPALPAGVSYTAVAAGIDHSLALRSDGQIVGWGDNRFGQTTAPALLEGVTYTKVAGGGFSGLAQRSDEQVVAWGSNIYGQTNVPVLPEGSKYIDIATSGFHSLAIIQSPKQAQALSFTSTAPTAATVSGTYTMSAEATSGLEVTLGTSTPSTSTLSGSTVSFIAAGECTVTADQAGNTFYNPATQVTQTFTISLPPVLADIYTVDFETAPLNTILYNVKVGQGVVYSGTGTANTNPIRVDGYRYLNGNRLGSNQAKVLRMAGDKVLTVVKAGTNTPNPSGGELDIKPTESFGGPTPGKNGRVTLTSVTVNGVSTNGAKLILYGDSKVIQAIALRKTPTQTLTLSVSGVAVIHVRANDS